MRGSGHQEVLGIWIEQTERATFWLRVMSEIKNRGTQAILIAVVDGLKGFPEAISTVFPDALVQTCLVHVIRYSMHFASWRERKAIAAALKPVYGAESATAAASQLEDSTPVREAPHIRPLRKAGGATGNRLYRSLPSRSRYGA